MATRTVAAAKSLAKKPAGNAAATGPVATVKHIAVQVSEAHEMPTNRAVTMLNHTVNLRSKHPVNGSKARIVELGVFQVKKHDARIGRKPRTGEPVTIKAGKKATFRPAKELKEAV